MLIMSNNHKLMKITNDPEIKKMLSNNSEKLITMIDRSVAGVNSRSETAASSYF